MNQSFRFRLLNILVLVLLLSVTLFGCSTPVQTQATAGATTAGTAAATTVAATTASGKISDTPITLKYFIALGDKATQVVKSNAEIAAYQKMEEKTGIKIEWQHPPAGQEMEQLNLIIASQKLPDLIFTNWNNYAGGRAKALSDNVIIKLNDQIGKNAPNLKKLMENKDTLKQMTLDDGTLCFFPVIRDDMSVRVWFGPQIRKDWRDRLNLKEPTTIDEWHTVLTAFKSQDANGNGDAKDEIPFASSGASGVLNFTGAFGIVRAGFCLNGSKVVFSPIQPAFKEFLSTMAKWYEEGLIDPDFVATDGNSFSSKVTSGKVGAYFGSLAGNLGRFGQALKQADAKADLIGTAWPKGAAGKDYQTEGQHIAANTGSGTAISSQCKNVDVAVKWLDYHYSEAGSLLLNFGVEGVSYKMVNGYPTFTDEIFKNPNGLTYDVALSKYALSANTTEAMRQDPREFEQYSLGTSYQKDANKKWGSGDTSLLLPPITPTADESAQLSKIMNEVNTYVNESYVKFIMGQEPIANFDKFAENIKNMNIQKAIDIQQAAYDRFQKR